MAIAKPSEWVRLSSQGLYVEPGDFYIDPVRPAARAVITHGHSDHARAGHGAVLATRETLAIMDERYGADRTFSAHALAYGETLDLNGVTLRLEPAGHILGSAQAVVEWRGARVVVSGDYKRRRDPTCLAFVPQQCDVFITEATFGLPVFRHPPDRDEIGRLLHSHALFPERSHVIGVYALGKCQRVIALLREAGYDRPIYLHGALIPLCKLYERFGVSLGPLRPVLGADKSELAGAIVLAPPSAIGDRWSRRLPDPVTAMASGWMRVKQRAKQRGVELPLVISDHADWDELTQTIDEVAAPEIWVTHGQEEALVHYARGRGLKAQALALVGYEDEDEAA
jgi:putative mRNA 3-end processing factor